LKLLPARDRRLSSIKLKASKKKAMPASILQTSKEVILK